MKSRLTVALLTLVVALLPALSMANEAIEAAEYAVRSLIRSKYGSQSRVAFDSQSERILSLTEEVVTGTGHIYDGNDWDFNRSFSYSIKVKYDGSSTRDLALTFTNGEKQTDTGDWKPSNHASQAVHITRPRWYEKLSSGVVVFEGTARSNVSINVFDRRGQKVVSNTVEVYQGRFRREVSLPSGQYRAFIATGGSDGDEIRFSVDNDSQDWGRPSAYLKVAEPGRDNRLRNSRVAFSGNSSERSVWLQVWDARNNRVVDRDIPVKDRYWNSEVVLGDGAYKFTVMVGASSETRNFTVDTGKTKPSNPGWGAQLSVSSPGRNDRVRTNSVGFAGTSSENSVWLQVWDSRNNRVIDQDIQVRNRSWSQQIALADGSYKFTVMVGASSETRSFTVDSGKTKPDRGPGPSGVTVRVTDPSRNGVVSGPRVTVAGNTPDGAVLVQIWDERDNEVVERRVPTSNQYFNTSIPMRSGRYRVRVTGHLGTNYQEFWFTVR